MNIHDVFRGLIRGYENTEANRERMLRTVEAHEKGYADLETYQAELDKQAEALKPGADRRPSNTTPDERDARIARLEAQLAAQTGRPGSNPSNTTPDERDARIAQVDDRTGSTTPGASTYAPSSDYPPSSPQHSDYPSSQASEPARPAGAPRL
jgi:hypothetical protein